MVINFVVAKLETVDARIKIRIINQACLVMRIVIIILWNYLQMKTRTIQVIYYSG